MMSAWIEGASHHHRIFRDAGFEMLPAPAIAAPPSVLPGLPTASVLPLILTCTRKCSLLNRVHAHFQPQIPRQAISIIDPKMDT